MGACCRPESRYAGFRAAAWEVEYPAVRAQALPLRHEDLIWSEASFDQACIRLSELAVLLARLGEVEPAPRRLLAEQHGTRKRVNALKYTIIPSDRATIRSLESALEEEERNTLFQIRLPKDRADPDGWAGLAWARETDSRGAGSGSTHGSYEFPKPWSGWAG